jgi:hypothetical protein
MTDVKHVFERVLDTPAPPLTPSATTLASAHRAARRRRTATTLAIIGAVVAVALAGTGLAALRQTDRPPPPIPAGRWPSDAVSWAIGTRIHVSAATGSDVIEVGHHVRAFVRTATGFVVLDAEDAVHSVTESGVTMIGQVNDTVPNNRDQQRLAVNAAGTLVGWVDESASPGALAFRTFDAPHGTTRDFRAGPRSIDDALFFAIDDRKAYWRTAVDGVHQVDLDTGADRLIVGPSDLDIPDEIYSFEVYSGENGVLAFSPNSDKTFFAGRSVDDATELFDRDEYEPQIPISDEDLARGAETIEGHVDPVRLSPTGRWLSFGMFEAVVIPVGEPGPDQPTETIASRGTAVVFDTASGQRLTLATPEATFTLPSVWLDDSTLQVAVVTSNGLLGEVATAVTFYECSLPHGTCHLRAESQLPPPQFPVFPDGRYYGP